MASRKPVVPVSPEVTLQRMKNIVLAECKYGIRGVASVDILAPHCAVALFMLSHGAAVVAINGERSSFHWRRMQADAHVEFSLRRAELRQSGPVKLRHIND